MREFELVLAEIRHPGRLPVPWTISKGQDPLRFLPTPTGWGGGQSCGWWKRGRRCGRRLERRGRRWDSIQLLLGISLEIKLSKFLFKQKCWIFFWNSTFFQNFTFLKKNSAFFQGPHGHFFEMLKIFIIQRFFKVIKFFFKKNPLFCRVHRRLGRFWRKI